MPGQRTWKRVEDPGTPLGHALEARLGSGHWHAWENRDGSWSARIDGGKPLRYRDWTSLRHAAEGSAQPNPLDPAVASAAAAGMAMAMRDHLINNPAPPQPDCQSELAVLGILGQVGLAGTRYLARRPRCDRYGNVWMMVRPGYGAAARRAVRRARLPFRVQIMESHR